MTRTSLFIVRCIVVPEPVCLAQIIVGCNLRVIFRFLPVNSDFPSSDCLRSCFSHSFSYGSYLLHFMILQLEALVSTDMGDSSRILHHADWTVKEVNMTSTSKTYDCCPETYQTVSYTIKLFAAYSLA